MSRREGVRLWLDDQRDPARHGRIGWTWAKTAQEAIAILASGRVVEASLDHDLCWQSMAGLEGHGEPTGMAVVEWMAETGIVPDVVRVHSLNRQGAERMRSALAAMGKRAPWEPAT